MSLSGREASLGEEKVQDRAVQRSQRLNVVGGSDPRPANLIDASHLCLLSRGASVLQPLRLCDARRVESNLRKESWWTM